MGWFYDMFIAQAIPALSRHSGGYGSDDTDQTYILQDESGNEVVAVFVDEETEFTATADDIRLGKTAVTEEGVTVGEKDIPAYHTIEGFRVITAGSPIAVTLSDNTCPHTKLLMIVCGFNTSISDSVAAELVSMGDKMYLVGSTEELATLSTDTDTVTVDTGLVNESGAPYVVRFISYKEDV